MRVRLKVLSLIIPVTCHCPECGKIAVSGEAAIQLVDLDAGATSTDVYLLRAEKDVPAAEKC